jgi:GTPase SAR1 family protein
MEKQSQHTVILMLSANPKGTEPLRLDEERREVEAGLMERSRFRDNFKLISKVAVRTRDLQRALLDSSPQIVHFSGHGQGKVGLALEDETGKANFVDAEALASLFELFSERLECVILNACYSEIQAMAIAQHIPYVIGMSDAISDNAAIEFAIAFYDALGNGRDINFAYKSACVAIRMAGISEEAHIPVIHERPSSVRYLPDKEQFSSMNLTDSNSNLINLTDTKPEHDLYNLSRLNMELLPKFREFLENTVIKFTHRNKENICLDDLFIFPDLKNTTKLSSEDPVFAISGKNIWGYNNRIIILGDEQSGKTTLAKRIFLEAYSSGCPPLFFDGANIKTSNVEELIHKRVSEIYGSENIDRFLQLDSRICIVDDISGCRLNNKAKSKLITGLHSYFSQIIFLAEESYRFTVPDFPELCEYKELEILPFGNARRSELIEKWVTLGADEETEDRETFKKIDELRLRVDSLVRKNILPAKPFYILLLFQALETANPQQIELTSSGHCYQHLIYQFLDRVHVKQAEFDTYFNILSELGGAILDSPSESLNEPTLNLFFKEYSDSFNFNPTDREKVIEDLVNSSILTHSDTGLRFRYRYLFYFFAAKKLADSLQQGKQEAKEKIHKLVDTLHLEKSSNIILFLTHHSKDASILDEILYSVMDLFSNQEEVTLKAGSLSFLQDFAKKIPDLVLENREARQERLEHDQQKDVIEQNEQDREKLHQLEINEDPTAFISKINKVFRAIEVCGQILRNRLGSLEKTSLESIVEESFSVSLRFLSLILKISDYVREETIREIENLLANEPTLSDSKIIQKIESFYFALNYGVILGMLHKVAYSLGSSKGREIYIKVAENKDSPASRLIQEIIELQFEKVIDFRKIEKLHSEFGNNPICDRLLKEIVLRHCYMHDIGYKDRQRIAEKLNISIHQQQLINIISHKTR